MSDELITKLREPVDQGGYDGFYSDGLHVAAANAIESLSAQLAAANAKLAESASRSMRLG